MGILLQNVFCFPRSRKYNYNMHFYFPRPRKCNFSMHFYFPRPRKCCRKMFFKKRDFGNVVAKCFLRNEASEKLSQNVFCFLSLWKRCRKMFYRKIIVFCHFSKDFIQKQLFFAIFMRILLRNNCFLPFPWGFYLKTIVF